MDYLFHFFEFSGLKQKPVLELHVQRLRLIFVDFLFNTHAYPTKKLF